MNQYNDRWLVVWKEVFQERFPEDVRNYITGNFIIPFVIAQREGERIESFLSTKAFIDMYKFNSGLADRPEIDTFNYIGANNLLLDDTLILDKRIDDGRHEKYVVLLEYFFSVRYTRTDTERLRMRGLDWDSFEAFRQILNNHTLCHIPKIYPNISAFIERLIIRIKIDTQYEAEIKRYLVHYSVGIIIVLLHCLLENAITTFIPYIPKNHEFLRYVLRQDSDTGRIQEIYDKYRRQLEKYLVLVFPQ